MKKTIQLSNVVVVSDPCYKIPTFAQIVLNGVKPGEYHTFKDKEDFGDSVQINKYLGVVHTEWVTSELAWREYDGLVGVDSGQAGIFSHKSYRNDEIVDTIDIPQTDFRLESYNDEGDSWYEAMCRLTLTEEEGGLYEEGVVSSSGFGDGVYRCLISKKNKMIVGICIDFGVENRPNKFINELFKQ
jgi:hypothetical protein